MKKIYNVSISLKTALHINAGTGADGRREYVRIGGEAYIPGSTIKGLLRNNFEMFVRTYIPGYSCVGKENAQNPCECVVCRLFGKAGFQPSRVIVDNFYPDDEAENEVRTNIAMNRYTRKTADGALVSQNVVSSSCGPVFKGNITVYYPDDLQEYEAYIKTALEFIDSVGSSKSRGLGMVDIKAVEQA